LFCSGDTPEIFKLLVDLDEENIEEEEVQLFEERINDTQYAVTVKDEDKKPSAIDYSIVKDVDGIRNANLIDFFTRDVSYLRSGFEGNKWTKEKEEEKKIKPKWSCRSC
jgi:hypothetical protein